MIFRRKKRNINLQKDIDFIKGQIEMNKLTIDSIKKYGGSTDYLEEENTRYKSILSNLDYSKGV